MNYTIEIYQTKEGKKPFDEWFKKLKDKQAKAIILTRLERLKLGNFGDAEPVGNSISELKIHFGPGYRIYHTKIGSHVVLLLCAGIKTTQKKDIVRADDYLIDYKKRQS